MPSCPDRLLGGIAALLMILVASGKHGQTSWFNPLGLTPAMGQTVNSGALDALTPARPAAPRPAPPRPVRPAHPAATPARNAAARPTAPARPPAVPATPPEIAAIPPAVAVPVGRPPPAPAVSIAADALGEASAIPGGVRVTFGPDRADLNPVTEPALRSFARTVKANEQATISVVATAAGSVDDPSTPRRLSLSRALAARAVLITEGIASTRIYVRALGANGPPDGPADRVDVSSAASGAPAPPAAPPTPAASAASAGSKPSTASAGSKQ